MEKAKRSIFFWTLVVLFIVIAPLVVMNARGYRFDFSRGVFVHSGTISLKTNPQDFSLYINDKIEDSKKLNRINSSYNISGLIPREYNLKITAEGFQSWTKKIPVHSGLSSEFWNILLVRDYYNRLSYAATDIDKFFISPKNKFIVYTKNNDSGLETIITDIDSKIIEKTFSFTGWNFIDETRRENIEWSPEEEYLSVPVKRILEVKPDTKNVRLKKNVPEIAPTIEYAYFVADFTAETSLNLNEFVAKNNLQNVRWDPKEKGYLFFLSENSLYRANIKDSTDLTLIAENVSGYDLSANFVYYSQMPNELVFKTGLDGKATPMQITNGFPESIAAPTEKLIVYDDERIVFINKNRDLFVYNKSEKNSYFRKIGGGIESIQFSDDGKKLLFWTANEISVYFLRPWNVQPTRDENEIQTITRYSETIRNIQWFKDYEHVIFNSGPYIKIIEIDSRDHLNGMDIAKTSTDSSSIIYNKSLEYLFFTDVTDDKTDLYYIIFPEPANFLGLFPPAQQ